jgi:hypothetical protein
MIVGTFLSYILLTRMIAERTTTNTITTQAPVHRAYFSPHCTLTLMRNKHDRKFTHSGASAVLQVLWMQNNCELR